MNLIVPGMPKSGVIGPSGWRKRSLVAPDLHRRQCPSKGWIAFNGQRMVFEEPWLREHRRKLGIVFQSWNLFPHLTALENIVLPLYRVHGLSHEEAEARSTALLKRFELNKDAHKKPYALSGGQVQRVALIRAVAGQPKTLMLDEPTSALDPLMSAEVLELILELKKEQRDLILVTHHLHFAKRIADWVLFVAHGQILEHGRTEDVLQHPKSPLGQRYMSHVLEFE